MSNQETRQVTIIANHINDNQRFESNASTFGELKEEQAAAGLFEGNIRVIIRETRNELSMNDSKLPDGGFTLIVVADKVKSGADQYDEMDYHELRSECINRGFSSDKYNGAGATKNVMRAHLRDDDELNEDDNFEDVEEEETVDDGYEYEEDDYDDDYDDDDDDYYEEDEDEEDYISETEPPTSETSRRFDEMKARIEGSVSKCKAEVTGILEEYTDILPDSVIPDYSDTIAEIKRELGL